MQAPVLGFVCSNFLEFRQFLKDDVIFWSVHRAVKVTTITKSFFFHSLCSAELVLASSSGLEIPY